MRAIWVPLVGVAFALAACNAGGGGLSTPTAEPSPAPTASPAQAPTPTPGLRTIGGVLVVSMRIAEPAGFPEGAALIVETGCYSCDGPASGLLRVYRDAAGAFHRDTIFAVEQLGLGPRLVADAQGAVTEEAPHMVGYALSADASRAVVGVCTRGFCVDIGAPPSADAQTTLFHSTDGGATWQQWGTVDGSAVPVAVAGAGAVIARPEGGLSPSYEAFPAGGEDVEVPEEAGALGRPAAMPDGELLWLTDDGRALRSDGSPFVEIGGNPDHEYQVMDAVSTPDGNSGLFSLYERTRTGELHEWFYLFTTDGSGKVLRAYSVEFLPWLGASLAAGRFLGNADVPSERTPAALRALGGPMPVLIDIEAGVVRPIVEAFSDPDFPKGRDFVVGVQR